MAYTSIASTDDVAQKIYRPVLTHQAERSWIAEYLWGTDDEAAVQVQDEPTRLRGDTVQVRFCPTEEHAGFGEDDDIEGNEASLKFRFHEYNLHSWAHAFAQRNTMSQQRVNFNLYKAALQKLPILWRRRWERSLWNQLGGAQYVTTAAGLAAIQAIAADARLYNNLTHRDNNLAGGNAVETIDENHIRRAKGSATAAAVAADTTAVMSLGEIDELRVRAESAGYMDYPIAPTSTGYYYLVISPEQKRQLRAGTSAGDWQDLQRALLEGGQDYKKSGLATDVVGLYNNTIIVCSAYLPRGWDTVDTPLVNTRRAIFIGAKAAVWGWGEGYAGENNHLDWIEQTRDYRKKGVAAESVYGCKRLTFPNLSGTTETFGSMVLETYVPN